MGSVSNLCFQRWIIQPQPVGSDSILCSASLYASVSPKSARIAVANALGDLAVVEAARTLLIGGSVSGVYWWCEEMTAQQLALPFSSFSYNIH